jgi:hypothetical protein
MNGAKIPALISPDRGTVALLTDSETVMLSDALCTMFFPKLEMK